MKGIGPRRYPQRLQYDNKVTISRSKNIAEFALGPIIDVAIEKNGFESRTRSGGPIKDNLETRAALYPASMGSFQPKGWMSVTLTDHVRAAMSSLLFVSAELSSFSSSECSRSNNSNLSRLGALFDVPLCVSLGEVGG